MVQCLLVTPHTLHSLCHKPLSSLSIKTRRIAEVLYAIRVFMVPACVNHDNVTLFNLGACLLQVFRHNLFPLFLRDRHSNSSTVVLLQGNLISEHATLKYVSW